MAISRRIIVSGRVQGVGFRAYVHGHARSLGLQGGVRNRRDGTVEVHAMGEEAQMEALITACREGPPASRVTDINVAEAEEVAEKGFRHMPTL